MERTWHSGTNPPNKRFPTRPRSRPCFSRIDLGRNAWPDRSFVSVHLVSILVLYSPPPDVCLRERRHCHEEGASTSEAWSSTTRNRPPRLILADTQTSAPGFTTGYTLQECQFG